jgi:hypothetical protein
VDIKAFQEKPTPLWQKITGHPGFWTFLFILVVTGTFGYLKYEKQIELAQRREYLKKGPQFISSSPRAETVSENISEQLNPNADTLLPSPETNPKANLPSSSNPNPTSPSSSTPQLKEEASNPNIRAQPNTPPTAASPPTVQAATVSSASLSPASVSNSSRTVTVTYYEVSEEQISQAMELASQRGLMPIDFGDYRATPLVAKVDPQSWIRLKSKRINLTSGQLESRWVEGSSDPEMGFLISLSVSGLSFPFQAEVEILKIIPEEAASELTPVSYPNTSMDIEANQNQWLISLRLPRTISKSAHQILKDPIFNIFTSDSFLKMKSEFTLVFDFGTQ